jgi:fatty acid desaturase
MTTSERERARAEFSVHQAQTLVRDLTTPSMKRYWIDLTLSAALGWVALAGAVIAPVPVALAIVFWIVAVLALYRAVIFIHEIAHFRQRTIFRRFRIGWNAMVGVPLLTPTFLYETHSEHHSKRLYATENDAEYRAFAHLAPHQIVGMIGAAVVAPAFGPWRFGLLAPISWLVPRARRFVYAQMSTLKIDLDYRGEPPKPGKQRRSWLLQEVSAFALVWGTGLAIAFDVVPWEVPVWWAATLAGIAAVNSVRLLGAHRYEAIEDEDMTVVDQMLDSINHPSSPIAGELWGPIGLKLHALHHLLPNLPYHALPEAHRRLVSALPANSAYRLTESPSLVHSIRHLWRSSCARQREQAVHARNRPDKEQR